HHAIATRHPPRSPRFPYPPLFRSQGVSHLLPTPAFRADAAYVHYCPNETIDGIEMFDIPATGDVPLVADLSSTILSRPLDVSRLDRKSTRLNSSHVKISYAVFCLK